MTKNGSTAKRTGHRPLIEKKSDVQRRAIRFLNELGPNLLEFSRSTQRGERRKIVAYLHGIRANVTEALNDFAREVRS